MRDNADLVDNVARTAGFEMVSMTVVTSEKVSVEVTSMTMPRGCLSRVCYSLAVQQLPVVRQRRAIQ